MNSSSKHRDPGGFTLFELVVTMAILSIILLLVLQVTETSRNAIRISEAKSNNDAFARRAFDQIGRDFSQLIVRDDARVEFKSMAGNDKIAFLANTRGLTTAADVGDRSVALVTYELIQDATLRQRLLRGSLGYKFADTAATALKLDASQNFPAISPNNLQSISNNLLRIEVEYLIRGTTGITREITPPATAENLRGLVISIVTLDDRSRRAVGVTRLPALAGKFTDAAISKNTLETWSKIRDDLAKSGYNGLPKEALQAIRCYQRTFLIP